jgi:hypothetical protein
MVRLFSKILDTESFFHVSCEEKRNTPTAGYTPGAKYPGSCSFAFGRLPLLFFLSPLYRSRFSLVFRFPSLKFPCFRLVLFAVFKSPFSTRT